MRSLWRRFTGFLFSIGEYPEESLEQAAKRRVFVVVVTVATLLTVPFVLDSLQLDYTQVATAQGVTAAMGVLVLILLHVRPQWFAWLVRGVLTVVTVSQMYSTWLFGGLLQSGLEVVFGLIAALVALLIFGRGAALFWFGIYVVQVVFAMAISGPVEPTYVAGNTTVDSGLTLLAAGIVIMAVTLYFVRQRDRFQKESDDLLHNILPDEIASRLKMDASMIADDFAEASVLFADLVDFTPMSADMSPTELVGLLNSVFTDFDEFVAELGLEKIKTVGDEYMVAGGVPVHRPDHAAAIAELALRIRDHVAAKKFDGHQLRLRIGINSGPVVAGIVGTHKFSYDLWGDTVNTASRMESEGIAGKIQMSSATEQLIRDRFDCEPRGKISVKGKGQMETFVLTGRSPQAATP